MIECGGGRVRRVKYICAKSLLVCNAKSCVGRYTAIQMKGCGPRKGSARWRGAWRRSRPLSSEWPASVPVLAISETCAWVSENI